MKQAKLDLRERQDILLTAMKSEKLVVDSSSPGMAAVVFHTGRAGQVTWNTDWWVIRTTPTNDSHPSFDRVQNALHLNALTGPVRHILSQDGADLALHAEFPLHDLESNDFDTLHERTVNACAALTQQLACGARHDDKRMPLPWDAADATGGDISLPALLRDAGWPSASDHDRHSRVELELRSGSQQANVEVRDDRIRLRVDLLDDTAGVSRECMYAASLFLLRAAAEMRLIAATVDLRESGFFPRLQVILPRRADAEWVGHGLAALSFAYGMMAGQIEILSGSEDIAARFLAMRTTQAAA